jgi:hypothetical protein
MHLVFLNQYYPPDVAPTGVMLEGVVRQLVRDGYEVTVLCASGGYGGQSGPAPAAPTCGARVVRIGTTKFGRGTWWGKLLDYASFYAGVAWKLLVLRPGRVVALTTPPYLSVVARLGSRLRGADHAHWVMDLYPDVMVAHGMLAEGSLARRVLAAVAAWGFGGRRCAAVVTLGPDMAARVGGYLSSAVAEWVPLWGAEAAPGTAAAAEALRQSRGWRSDEVVVMYSGNMGLGHRFDGLLAAALAMREAPVRFAFYGTGRRRGEIEEFMRTHPECRVELHDYAPAEQLAEHLQSADVHLASLDPAWTGTMVPSKLQGIFAAGRPVIFLGGSDSSIGQWVAQSGGGWVLPPDDGPGLLAALAEACQTETRAAKGHAAGRFAADHFSQAINIPRVAAILSRNS